MNQAEHIKSAPAGAANPALLGAVAEFERTTLRLQDALVVNIACCAAIRCLHGGGATMSATMTSINVGQRRADLTESIADLEAARHHLRSVCFALAIAEGLSIGAVARLWGVSRQLAQRTVREVDLSVPAGGTDKSRGGRP
jgi:hypothetical protein